MRAAVLLLAVLLSLGMASVVTADGHGGPWPVQVQR